MSRIGGEFGPLTLIRPTDSQTASATRASGDGAAFAEALEQAISNVSGSMHEADNTASEALVGEAAPHEAMIALAKADLKFRMFTQTRNKLVDAYNELMNIRM